MVLIFGANRLAKTVNESLSGSMLVRSFSALKLNLMRSDSLILINGGSDRYSTLFMENLIETKEISSFLKQSQYVGRIVYISSFSVDRIHHPGESKKIIEYGISKKAGEKIILEHRNSVVLRCGSFIWDKTDHKFKILNGLLRFLRFRECGVFCFAGITIGSEFINSIKDSLEISICQRVRYCGYWHIFGAPMGGIYSEHPTKFAGDTWEKICNRIFIPMVLLVMRRIFSRRFHFNE